MHIHIYIYIHVYPILGVLGTLRLGSMSFKEVATGSRAEDWLEASDNGRARARAETCGFPRASNSPE